MSDAKWNIFSGRNKYVNAYMCLEICICAKKQCTKTRKSNVTTRWALFDVVMENDGLKMEVYVAVVYM